MLGGMFQCWRCCGRLLGLLLQDNDAVVDDYVCVGGAVGESYGADGSLWCCVGGMPLLKVL